MRFDAETYFANAETLQNAIQWAHDSASGDRIVADIRDRDLLFSLLMNLACEAGKTKWEKAVRKTTVELGRIFDAAAKIKAAQDKIRKTESV